MKLKLNNHGQTLVLFIIFIPLFIMILAFTVDTGIIMNEKTKLNSTTKTIMQNLYDKRLDSDINDEIINLYKKNNIDVSNLKITIDDKKMNIQNDYYIKSIFGSIVGLTKYEVKINLSAFKKEDRIIFKQE